MCYKQPVLATTNLANDVIMDPSDYKAADIARRIAA